MSSFDNGSYKHDKRVAIDKATREEWNPRFNKLGFDIPPGRIPSNKPGAKLFIPTEAARLIVDEIFAAHKDVTLDSVAETAGLPQRRITMIRSLSSRYTDLNVIDKIVTGHEMTHLWHTDYKDVYDFAFRDGKVIR